MIYIGHRSALAFWLTRTSGQDDPEYVRDRGLALAEASAAAFGDARPSLGFLADGPVHLMVPDGSSKRHAKGTVTHAWSGSLPAGAFCELGGSCRIASPELTYLLMAARHPLRQVVEWGCYLCGGFAIAEEGYGYVGSRRPLTTPDDIRAFIERADHSYGAKPALEALEYVVARLASPMEVFLGMECAMPGQLGGFEFPPIVANEELVVPEELRLLAGTRHYFGDLYIPSVNGDLEFDSAEFHTGPARLDHDQTRRNILEVMGTKTVTATYGQVRTFEKFESFVRMTKGRFGIPTREFSRVERLAQSDLHEFLLAPRRPRF